MWPKNISTAAPISASTRPSSATPTIYRSALLTSPHPCESAFELQQRLPCDNAHFQPTMQAVFCSDKHFDVEESEGTSKDDLQLCYSDISHIYRRDTSLNGQSRSAGWRPSDALQERRSRSLCRQCNPIDDLSQTRANLLLSRAERAHLLVALRRLYPLTLLNNQDLDDACHRRHCSRSSRSHRSSSSYTSSPTTSSAGSTASIPSASTAPSHSISSSQSSGHPRLSVSSLLCEDPEANHTATRARR
ncbi:hypothetical protein NEOLEDRAFT_58247 [Neolentinus lepideus HHB14362 ss-1]|uniref:Uncharacterized protein n=1 Tax=Neolentinus lepideus HHB14362 ss-1 TaxID=1314782 RepID=A0A165U7I1_9AGAM|nr:hypothetical protein NEOLEDRAFT_58247 [Neolentinus lepideus HHB14362 ss-1]